MLTSKKFAMRGVITCLVLLPAVTVLAQEPVDTAMMSKIREEENVRSQVAEIAHQLTDVIGPRLTNSPGYNHALDWLTTKCNAWGLEKAGREPWGEFGKGWSNEHASLTMTRPYHEPIISYPIPWSKSTMKGVTADLIMLNDLDSASIDSVGAGIKGKIVMIRPSVDTIPNAFATRATRYADTGLNNFPDKYMFTREEADAYLPLAKKRYYAIQYLEKKGAVALLLSSLFSIDGTVFVDGGSGYKRNFLPSLPAMKISREDYLKMERLVDGKEKVALSINIQNTFYSQDLTGYNFVAEIPGSDPALKEEVVMLGGHLDSWAAGTGATDNAAGCIATLEAVRLLKALGVKPRRTIRIALWGGEEQGLYGSFGYVKKHFGDPANMKLLPEQEKISAYFNLDNGSGKIRGIYLQGNAALRPIFTSWLAPFADLGASGVTNSNTGSTDHISFDAVGIPAFQFIQDPLEYELRTHHSNMDVYDHLAIEDLRQASAIIAAFVYNAAMRDQKLPRKPLPAARKFVFDFDFPI